MFRVAITVDFLQVQTAAARCRAPSRGRLQLSAALCSYRVTSETGVSRPTFSKLLPFVVFAVLVAYGLIRYHEEILHKLRDGWSASRAVAVLFLVFAASVLTVRAYRASIARARTVGARDPIAPYWRERPIHFWVLNTVLFFGVVTIVGLLFDVVAGEVTRVHMSDLAGAAAYATVILLLTRRRSPTPPSHEQLHN